jgi:hypothetical protein
MSNEDAVRKAQDIMEEATSYRVYLLGTSGAGKTTFLPCFHKRNQLLDGKLGYKLSCVSIKDGIELKGQYDDLIKDGRLLSTEKRRAWEFYCQLVRPDTDPRDRRGDFRFTFVDYPGGDAFQKGGRKQELVEEIESLADASVGLLDGALLCRLKKHKDTDCLDQEDTDYLDQIEQMAAYMQCAPVSYFLITKWDLVEGEYTFDEIQAYLTSLTAIQKMMDWYNVRGRIPRLIPISSVGTQFFDPSTGEPLPNRQVESFNLDAAFYCLVPDLAAIGRKAANDALRKQRAKRDDSSKTLANLLKGAKAVLPQLVPVLLKLPDFFGKDVSKDIKEVATSLPPTSTEQALSPPIVQEQIQLEMNKKKLINDLLKELRQHKDKLVRAQKHFTRLQRIFDRRFPKYRLAARQESFWKLCQRRK